MASAAKSPPSSAISPLSAARPLAVTVPRDEWDAGQFHTAVDSAAHFPVRRCAVQRAEAQVSLVPSLMRPAAARADRSRHRAVGGRDQSSTIEPIAVREPNTVSCRAITLAFREPQVSSWSLEFAQLIQA